MKLFRVFVFLFALCVLLSACASPSNDSSASQTDATEASAPTGSEPWTPEATLPAKGEYAVQELCFYRDGKRIYGELYLPQGDGPFAAVVIGHGLESNLNDTRCYAEAFASYGIAAYVFDFIGGGTDVLSDGDVMEMTLLTEAADMSVVLDGIRDLDAIDAAGVFLMGCSQGGFVATYTAAKRTDDVKALIAFYPAYGIQDDVRERTANGNHITEEISTINDIPVGRAYIEDVLSFSIFELMRNYPGHVLIVTEPPTKSRLSSIRSGRRRRLKTPRWSRSKTPVTAFMTRTNATPPNARCCSCWTSSDNKRSKSASGGFVQNTPDWA